MTPVYLALASVCALLAAAVAGHDAATRDRPWGRVAVGVGGATAVGCGGALLSSDWLVTSYAAVTGGPLVVTSPREVFALVVGVVALVAVLSGYGALSRFRPTG
ncbi:hypothetical protein ACFQL1_05625 [Halomicroarcula sp. GCM10025709]|uniref:hypothetical protein n=1 Tax=Haloarcula TaxID=2237 RepID=UPI0024C32AFA|nr:hypothetical protein [Halomicroarcula sp. YJ-61-S]